MVHGQLFSHGVDWTAVRSELWNKPSRGLDEWIETGSDFHKRIRIFDSTREGLYYIYGLSLLYRSDLRAQFAIHFMKRTVPAMPSERFSSETWGAKGSLEAMK